jgi:hypothetical protein
MNRVEPPDGRSGLCNYRDRDKDVQTHEMRPRNNLGREIPIRNSNKSKLVLIECHKRLLRRPRRNELAFEDQSWEEHVATLVGVEAGRLRF